MTCDRLTVLLTWRVEVLVYPRYDMAVGQLTKVGQRPGLKYVDGPLHVDDDGRNCWAIFVWRPSK